jgi:hypothetical protein
MKRRRFMHLYLLVLLVLGLGCYAGEQEFILNKDDTAAFKVEKSPNNEDIIFISGLAMHSSFSVSEISMKYLPDGVLIYVYMAPAKKGLRGDFIYPIYTGNNIHNIFFGDKMTRIWRTEHTE